MQGVGVDVGEAVWVFVGVLVNVGVGVPVEVEVCVGVYDAVDVKVIVVETGIGPPLDHLKVSTISRKFLVSTVLPLSDDRSSGCSAANSPGR